MVLTDSQNNLDHHPYQSIFLFWSLGYHSLSQVSENTVQADYHVPSVLVFFFDIIHNRKTTTPATETGEHHQRRVDWDRLDGLGQRTTWDVSINYECQLKEIRNGMSRNEHEDPFNATTTNVIARAVLGWDRQSASLASRWEWNVRGLLINFH